MQLKAAEQDSKVNAKGSPNREGQRADDLTLTGGDRVDLLLRLQRARGNGYVQRLLHSALVQPKLTIGEPGDQYEQEADQVADQVMRMSDPAAPAMARPERQPHISRLQRKCTQCEEEVQRQPIIKPIIKEDDEEEGALQATEAPGQVPEVTPEVEAQIDSLRGGGQPLPESERQFFEPRFGYDFSGVRVHTDLRATGSAKSVNALAYTVGQDVVFGAGQYAPETSAGRRLLAHELTHVVQQTGALQRDPDDKKKDDQAAAAKWPPFKPPSSAAKDVISFFNKLSPPVDVKQYFVVDKNTLTIYQTDGKLKASFTVKRPGLIDATGYYLGSPFYARGWVWITETSKDKYEAAGLSEKGKQEAKKGTSEMGKALQALDTELSIIDWIQDADIGKFWENSETGLIGMAVMNTPIKSASSAAGKEGPVLSHNYPDWFKDLKKKIESIITEERKNKDNPNLPDKIFFYGSDKVQAQRGADAWTIEVEKGKREAYLTVNKKEWDGAADKDAYAQEVTAQLYKKVKLMIDESELQKREEKEITEIDSAGEKKKGNKWAWAINLKKQIETLLAAQKQKESAAKDFPDKLTLSTQGEGNSALAYLRVWVYKEVKDAKPDALPELSGGALPTALTEKDKAENWVPIVRKAADALRRGAVTTDPNAAKSDKSEGGDAKGDPSVLPPYPAKIHPMDLNPDRTTATIASNNFRMVIDTAAIHGNNLLNLTTIHMGMNIGYSWKVYPLPEALKNIKDNPQVTPDQLLQQANDYTRKNSSALGEEKDSYDADFDWEQSVKMSGIGEGEFLLFSKAAIGYPEDWNMKRQASVAGLPFTVKKAEDLAAQVASADSDAIKALKDQLAKEKDEKKKQQLQDQIKELEEREKSDLLSLTRKDEAETERLIKKAGELKKFIKDDRSRKLNFTGNKDYDPFMFRLKAFDKDLYSLYILVRQVFDYRYDDLYAIDEYTKLVQQQRDELQKLEKRTLRLTDNEKLRKDLPTYRCVAALVKEDDGNVVPLILLVGHHADSKPSENKYKMMILDVTFDSPKKGDMTYVGGEKDTEVDAIKSAFVEFGEDNKYGDGKIVYRVTQKGYKDQVDSVTTFTEYLGYALAALGIALLIAGTIISGGALAPATAAAVGAVVTALGISTAVAGAILAGRNIYKRVEKGTFELDAEFALDVVSIIGAAVQALGTVGKLATLARGVGAAQRLVQIQRLDKLLAIYDAVELGGNVVLVGLKVKEDVDAVKALNLPKDQEDEMLQQIAMEAVQQGAMLAYATFSKVKDISDHITAKVEASRYRSMKERGWVDEHGNPTEDAPPFLRKHTVEPGKTPNKAMQGEQAWKETQVLDMAAKPTADGGHKLTVTEKGRIIRCSDFCTDLRMKYNEALDKDPWMNKEMTDLETRAKQAAKSGDKAEAEKVAADASAFEAKLKHADDLRKHLFGMTDQEINEALEGMEAGKVTGGAKSGHKIDDVRIPKRQRRQIDVTDIMTEAEMKELGKGGYNKALERMNNVMGKKISDIPELKQHWDAARSELLKGKEVTDYSRETVIGMYKDAQRKFWEKVRKDPTAVAFLKKHGFEFEGDSGAALAALGPQGSAATERGNITNQERRISLDHVKEKAQGDNWKQALDADNLELMFQNANSWKEIVQVKFGMRDKDE